MVVRLSSYLPSDLRQLLRNRFVIVALAALALVPMLYASLYLYANWDPYGRLERFPVAVVNEDQGSALAGKPLNVGAEVARRLRRNREVSWRFASRAQAMEQLERGEVHLVVVIPENFSSRITALERGGSLHPAQIRLVTNPAKNYIGGQLSENIGARIIGSVSASVAQQVAGGVLSRLQVMAVGLGQADEALAGLKEGAGQLADGAGQLSAGLREAHAGTSKLVDGARELARGESVLVDGLEKTTSGTKVIRSKLQEAAEGAGQLRSNLSRISEGSHEIGAKLSLASQGLGEVERGLDTVDDGSAKLADSLGAAAGRVRETRERVADFEKTLEEVQRNPLKLFRLSPTKMVGELVALRDGLGQLADGLETASGKLGEMKSGAAKMASGVHEVRSGLDVAVGKLGEMKNAADQLAQGAGTLQNGLVAAGNGLDQVFGGQVAALQGAAKLRDGAGQLQSGLTQLDGGLDRLEQGSSRLTDGGHQVAQGLDLLYSRLHPGVAELQSAHLDEVNGVSGFLTHPIDQTVSELHPVPNYGTGFAPYFICLALWIGIVMSTFIVKMDDTPESLTWRSTMRYVTRKYLALSFIALVQTIVLFAVLQGGLGLKVLSPWGLYLLTYLTAVTFVTVIAFLSFSLGLAGRFLAVIVLLLQLVTAGGTFPYDLIPTALRSIGRWFPMTYSVSGMRSLISGGQDAPQAFAALAFFALLFALGAVVVTRFNLRLRTGDDEKYGTCPTEADPAACVR